MQFDGVVFPGQGIQHLGMGKDFKELYTEAKDIFQIASDALNFDVYEICQNNEIQLNSTEYTQPCVLTVEMAMYQVLNKYYNLSNILLYQIKIINYFKLVIIKIKIIMTIIVQEY